MKYDKINVESGIDMYDQILLAEESDNSDAKAKVHARIYEGLYKGLEDKIMNRFLEAIKHQDNRFLEAVKHQDNKIDHLDAKFNNVQHSLDILLERKNMDVSNDAINIANKSKNWSKYATIAAAIGVALAVGNILPSLHHFI